ncbi:DUF1254 domain-containing protein [Nocardia farcinica]|uniref:DUF1254 domain-containing protein n=1 Tax=Nocardia farcinica TaxID=37329 RepID=UPI002453F72F|nr:DUF1254 domain-containing protein [Nocardia farcinica]
MRTTPTGDRSESERGSAVAVYDPASAEQLTASQRFDVVPSQARAREKLARALTMQAVVYGLPSVYQYASMCAQCAPAENGSNWKLGEFAHGRAIAGPGYQAFRVPNVDTLYSNAWLDLTDGPVCIELPDFGGRYYTLNFLDAYSNASNISARTHPGLRRFLVATPGWNGPVPAGFTLFRVATPLMWILMRIQVFDADDLPEVHRLQDSVTLHRPGDTRRPWPVVTQEQVEVSAEAFLTALDTSLRVNGVPIRDAAYVGQFRTLGVGSHRGGPVRSDAAIRRGAEAGFRDAMELLAQSRPLLGRPIGTGWTQVLDKGAHGDNFLARAVMNFVGLGANVVEENCSYNTYVDAHGAALDGSAGATYRIEMSVPPPAEAFWSITVYEADTGWLHDAPGARHSVGTATNIAHRRDDPWFITIGASAPANSDVWLPCPPKRFFLVLRIYQPGVDALTGRWTPPPVLPSVGPTFAQRDR